MSYLAEMETDAALVPLQSAPYTYRIALGRQAGQKVLTLNIRPISGDGIHFGLPRMIRSEIHFIVSWSRIFNDKEILVAINTDYYAPKTAWVTIDHNLHRAGDHLRCIYSTDESQVNTRATIEDRNGKSVLLTIPPAGFVIYEEGKE